MLVTILIGSLLNYDLLRKRRLFKERRQTQSYGLRGNAGAHVLS